MNAGSAFRDVLRREDERNVRRIAMYMKNPRQLLDEWLSKYGRVFH